MTRPSKPQNSVSIEDGWRRNEAISQMQIGTAGAILEELIEQRIVSATVWLDAGLRRCSACSRPRQFPPKCTTWWTPLTSRLIGAKRNAGRTSLHILEPPLVVLRKGAEDACRQP